MFLVFFFFNFFLFCFVLFVFFPCHQTLLCLPHSCSVPLELSCPCSPQVPHTVHLSRSQKDPNRFDRDRLFSAVVRGSPEALQGLLEYLRRNSKFLTNSEYTGRFLLLELFLTCSWFFAFFNPLSFIFLIFTQRRRTPLIKHS